MAKVQRDTGRTISGKSAYGTESSFVIQDATIELAQNEVLCKDERGYYITFKERVDSGMADPRRWANERIKYVPVGT